MSELDKLTEKALRRAMRSAGFAGGPEVYERPLAEGFELRVQPWLEDGDDGSVELSPIVWVACPAAEQVLEGLRRDEAPWVRRDPDMAATLRGPEEVDGAVAAFVAAVEAADVADLRTTDGFAAALRADPEMADEAPVAVPVVLAVLGREAEAREALADYRAARGDGDYAGFAARFEAWLAGAPLDPEPPPETPQLAFGDLFKEVLRRQRTGSQPPPPPRREGAPGLGALFRAGARILRGEEAGIDLPPIEWRWVPVELDAGAGAVLERAAKQASVIALLQAAGDGRYRVVVEGTAVGSVVTAPTREISVLGRVEPGPVLEIRLRAQS
jgi:hypothetical protein